MIYQNSEELLKILASTPKGKARAEILNEHQNRSLVLNSGSSVTIYSGEIREGSTIKEKLSSIFVMTMKRQNARTGKPDGLGTFGGLAERTNPLDFYHMSIDEKLNLLGKKDDIILVNETPVLTKEMSIICKNNTLRESREELGDLGIKDINLENQDFEQITIDGLKDDNYITNIWNGEGAVYAITPYCHLLKVDEGFIDMLQNRSNAAHPEEHSEASAIEKRSLFSALSCFGNKSGIYKSEDGRDLQKDYRYPHEWLMTWVIASKQLQNDPEQMVELAQEVQMSSPHLVDFNLASQKMNVDSSSIAKTLGISEETFKRMQDSIQTTHNQQQQIRYSEKTYEEMQTSILTMRNKQRANQQAKQLKTLNKNLLKRQSIRD